MANIYRKIYKEIKKYQTKDEIVKIIDKECICPEIKNDACINENTSTSSKISINKASKEELQTLPGIGEAKAKDIVSYREQNGPFTKLEDITKVSGIGENVFVKIKDYITL